MVVDLAVDLTGTFKINGRVNFDVNVLDVADRLTFGQIGAIGAGPAGDARFFRAR